MQMWHEGGGDMHLVVFIFNVYLNTLKKDKSLKNKIHNGSKLIKFLTMPH